ncbi:MAG: hypothetical protein UV61_C0009G0045 [Candidatus Gottesmanbacteria bacterium GW2011_GWB1_43_11]|uniref:Hydrogenase maturation protease n=1 Tax=Candidatus Gottesmanbacteria bacterium GW2011_GWB1_43_11 TaxID=1618446 RepID=A0A0G1FI39_9BACT|nr:MAG: hypothetical protein UV17_C0031G0016 [Candidatus Gottesmanbacteria bacterium GW2011_GWA1_42_26]KKS81399.1 MAG: hypothetical protein UV55_C0015G0045 [Candidatus Gottesmanbacteria bacterium GW2011_GWC1_43_10]KKS86518.1 MAG: hypothetical protein UV61_C0009G0045 [Candidatus Gottesmanbacteria bacterium GW2011_GWB1_43_11]OGG07473.1 MAG: hypothetical protein A2699_03105 [Candidatus Gottesmanbacteria bacterium RIFCSPHIGHO2_01_FULL_43_15]HCM38094.1 hypothetical protein [Patescibacteria group bac
MKVYIVGNPLVKVDSLPFKLLPKLRKEFPEVRFEEADPTENFIPENDSIIIDTVVGIDHVRLFTDLDEFVPFSSVSAHDYDLGLHLQLLKKLGKIISVSILGIPISIDVSGKKKVMELLHSLFNRSARNPDVSS